MSYKSFEEVINQSKFSSEFQRSVLNIFYTANFLRDNHAKVFKEFDIQAQHYNVLRILKGKHPEPVQPGYIKEVMLDKGCDLTRLIDKLEKKELIHRCVDSENKRKMNVTLTNKGVELLDKMRTPVEVLNAKLKNNFTEEEARNLSDLLDKLRGQ
jgi:DNA-binding MarR family transcriptional regulator